jgi:hypothetical protein
VNTMTENTENSALAAIVGRLGVLSEPELRQLYLIVGVRLGFPDGASPGLTRKTVKGAEGGKASSVRPGPKKSLGQVAVKGNPSRKSQWVNHPLYKEYSRLKKVVESQSKEARTSFNAVDTPERRAYDEAFILWMEAKSSFRDRKTHTKDDDSDEESEDETELASGQKQAGSSSAQLTAGSSGHGSSASKTPASPPSKTANPSSPPRRGGKGKAPAK